MKDPWATLRILPTRDLSKIKAAYRAHAQKVHPDKARTHQEKKQYTIQFIELREAYVYAMFLARYEPELQPPPMRRPPDLIKDTILSRDWFMAALVIAAGIFGLWLVSMSAGYASHEAAQHPLPVIQSIQTVVLTRRVAFARRKVVRAGGLRVTGPTRIGRFPRPGRHGAGASGNFLQPIIRAADAQCLGLCAVANHPLRRGNPLRWTPAAMRASQVSSGAQFLIP